MKRMMAELKGEKYENLTKEKEELEAEFEALEDTS